MVKNRVCVVGYIDISVSISDVLDATNWELKYNDHVIWEVCQPNGLFIAHIMASFLNDIIDPSNKGAGAEVNIKRRK